MLRIFILKKSRVKLEGGRPPPLEHNRVKNFVYHLTLVSTATLLIGGGPKPAKYSILTNL